ncbi:MAG: hypothetical protein K2K55_05755 [Duncaniella sp.]|nr:hypothetical protein [Duncaniella sp.]
MRKIVIVLLLSLISSFAAFAQGQPSKQDRESWLKEMQQYKVDFIAKKLSLSDEEKTKFAAIYNKMDKELRAVQDETMKMERQVRKKGDKATNLELEKAAEAQFELKGKEHAIEMKYYPKFKSVLSPTQLFKLKEAERKFMRHVMKEHQKNKK